MRKGIMDDRDVERATQEISNDIKEGQWKIREYNRSVAGRKNKNHALSGLEISASGSVRIYPE